MILGVCGYIQMAIERKMKEKSESSLWTSMANLKNMNVATT